MSFFKIFRLATASGPGFKLYVRWFVRLAPAAGNRNGKSGGLSWWSGRHGCRLLSLAAPGLRVSAFAAAPSHGRREQHDDMCVQAGNCCASRQEEGHPQRELDGS